MEIAGFYTMSCIRQERILMAQYTTGCMNETLPHLKPLSDKILSLWELPTC